MAGAVLTKNDPGSKEKRLVIFGAGEMARMMCEYFTWDSNYCVDAFVVDKSEKQTSPVDGIPCLSVNEAVDHFPPHSHHGFVAVADNKNYHRRRFCEIAETLGYSLTSYVSSKAFVWHDVSVGKNTAIMEGNVLQSQVSIGDRTILWSGNHIGHLSKVGSDVFVSSHCVISGSCVIEDGCFLGVNCTLVDTVRVGSDSFVGATSLVKRSLPSRSRVVPKT